jgi:hypothetical protein
MKLNRSSSRGMPSGSLAAQVRAGPEMAVPNAGPFFYLEHFDGFVAGSLSMTKTDGQRYCGQGVPRKVPSGRVLVPAFIET